MPSRVLTRAVTAPLTAVMMLTAALPAQAALVSTESVIQQQEQSDRAKVDTFLAREDMRQRLQELGVNPDEARARVQSLSDEEVSRVARQIDSMPAGGDAVGVVIGAAVLIFVILLITDIAGLTDVFPFVHSKSR